MPPLSLAKIHPSLSADPDPSGSKVRLKRQRNGKPNRATRGMQRILGAVDNIKKNVRFIDSTVQLLFENQETDGTDNIDRALLCQDQRCSHMK